jgi:hypothetical protein
MRRALVVAIVVGLAAPAGADTQPEAEEPPVRRDGYGLGIVVSDLVSAGLVAGAYGTFKHYEDCECEEFASGYLVMFGAGGYLMGAPMIHHEHGRDGRAWQSAALRLTLPLVGLLAARMVDPPDEHDRGALNETSGWFFLGGALTAMAIDWSISF